MARVVILGAGLSGLSTAYHLEQAGCFDYVVFEKNERSGGLLRSVKQDGFTFDYTGHLLHINDDYFKRFILDITSLDNFDHIARRSAVHLYNTLVDYPLQMNLYGLPKNVIISCIVGFLNRKKNIQNPRTFYRWVLKYFGAGLGEHFFFPYNSKILAYDIKKVYPYTGRFIPETNIEAIISGALEKAQERHVGYNNRFYYPKTDGIEFLIKKIVARLQNTIKINHEATRIDQQTKTVYFANGHKEKYDTLVSTMPLNNLLENVSNTRVSYDDVAKKLLCNCVVNFNLGFNAQEISDKHWVYFPEQKYPFYRIGFWHNISASSVKKTQSAIYGELSYMPGTKTKKEIQELTEQAIQKALDFLRLNRSHIVTKNMLHLDHAYVIYDQWREKHLSKLLCTLEEQAIYSIGRFGAWKYSSMQEAVLEGKDVAGKIYSQAPKKYISSEVYAGTCLKHVEGDLL